MEPRGNSHPHPRGGRVRQAVVVHRPAQEQVGAVRRAGVRAGVEPRQPVRAVWGWRWVESCTKTSCVVLSLVVAAYLERNLKSLNTDGRLVLIGLMGGTEAHVAISLLLMKRLRVIGSTLRARAIEAKGELMHTLQERVWPLIASSQIAPIVDQVVAIEDAEKAHELIASDKTFGKVILEVGAANA